MLLSLTFALAGCFTSQKEQFESAVANPIMLEVLPPEVHEVEVVVNAGDAVTELQVELKQEAEIQSFVKGEKLSYQHPMPTYQPIFSIWKKGEQEVQKNLAYHAWDLNLDGNMDMFEGVDLSGKVYIQLFDYDFDGKIDHIDQQEEVAKVEDLETLEVK